MVMDNHLSIDLDWIKTKHQLDFVNELIFESIQVDQVNFCVQHQALFHFFKNLKSVCLYNLDHHHDVIYQKEWKGVNEGNWIYPLFMKGAIKEYHWIKNLDSEIQDKTPETLTTLDIVYKVYDDFTWIKNLKFTSLSICLSPESHFCEVNRQSLWETYKYYFKTRNYAVQVYKTDAELFGLSREMQ